MPEQLNLYGPDPLPGIEPTWKPPVLGTLPPGPVALDTETTGLNPFGGHRPIGVALATIERGYYYPWGHRSGPQLQQSMVLDWLKAVIQNREVYLANARFDIHMLRTVGVDLEALGCRVRDVQFHAALLNEQRRQLKFNRLAQECVGEGKLELTEGKVCDMPSGVVGPYAERDAHLTLKLARYFAPRLDDDELRDVANLEDDLIYVTCEMEQNGAPLDMDKLERWNDQVQSLYVKEYLKLSQLAGFKVNVNSTPQLY